MSFLLIVIISLAALGAVAALLSMGGNDEPVSAPDSGCGTCASRSECKLADLVDKGGKVCGMLLMLLLLASCSTKKNTSQTRLWHSFTARYNTYYNGSQAFVDGSLEKEKGNHDNYTELIPLYTVGNKDSRQLGSAMFDRAIEKSEKTIKQHSIKSRPEWTKNRRKTQRDIEWLSRREYNPFLWRAWLLLGKSQFQKGEFEEAAATFSYMTRLYGTQPFILGISRAWQAKSYVELGWLYDAEDIILKQRRDSMHFRAVKDWDYTYADYYLRTGRYAEAITYLRKVIRHERRRTQKAREWFLMGQLQSLQGNQQAAYDAFAHVIRLSPPYELEFNARISQTEVMARTDSKRMISKLRRMASSDNNKDYLDQVYYAIGNIYLSRQDTLKAIEAYEEGVEKATRNGIEKGVLLLTLGNVYWQRDKFVDAQRCYGQAIGLLDKDRPDYSQLAERSKILDELAPHIGAVELQDSLQRLSLMQEDERNAIIDKVIEELKKKEKEDRYAQEAAEAERIVASASVANSANNTPQAPQPAVGNSSSQWYFYNPQAVSQGKQSFQQLWGKRENTDNWRRSNRTVVSLQPEEGEQAEGDGEEAADSLQAAVDADGQPLPVAEKADGEEQADSAAADPHKREYYLAQIPFTDEQKAESNNIIKAGLFQAGIILKDKLDNQTLSERLLTRLTTQYPEYEKNDETLYHLFLLYSRQQRTDDAQNVLAALQRDYPESTWTVLLSDPNFADNQRFGIHLEDSLYASTYDAFRNESYGAVHANAALASERFPMGAHQPKFLFLEGLTCLNEGDVEQSVAHLRSVVEKYPDSEVSEMAGMIVRGVQEGRKLGGGKFDMSDVWTRRSLVMSSDSTASDTLTFERNAEHVFLLAYQTDSVNQNQLLFELARYNFSNFMVRNFDIEVDQDANGLCRMLVSGFNSYDEARQYAQYLYAVEGSLRSLLHRCRSLIVSKQNLPLLGANYSYHDYEVFMESSVAPVVVSQEPLLDEPAQIVQDEDADDQQPAADEDGRQPQPAANDDVDDLGLPAPQPQQQPVANDDVDDFGLPASQQGQPVQDDYEEFDEDFWR